MKAALFREHGGLDRLHVEDVPDPVPGPKDVVIRVRSCSINRADIGAMQFSAPTGHSSGSANGLGFAGFALPHVPGVDPSGEIAAVGSEVKDVKIGERVVTFGILSCGGTCDICKRGLGENFCRDWRVIGLQEWGGYAEYVKVPARNILPLPDAVSFDVASAISVVYTTAYHGIVTRAGLKASDSMLVLAAGSGIGAAGLDIGKFIGCKMIAAAGSDWKVDRAISLGAAGGVNYTKPGWSAEVKRLTDGKGVDVILDSVGLATWDEAMRSLDRAGRVVVCGATSGTKVQVDLRSWYRNDISMYTNMQGTYDELKYLIQLAAEGKLNPVIDSRFPLSEVRSAQQRLEDRTNFGKVILNP